MSYEEVAKLIERVSGSGSIPFWKKAEGWAGLG
jgi:hypothetical protein